MNFERMILEKWPGKRVSVIADAKTFKDVTWLDGDGPTKTAFNAVLATYDDSPTYYEKRIRAYHPLGDQLDRVTKALKHLAANGIDIGPDGTAQVNHSDAVKAAHPKP